MTAEAIAATGTAYVVEGYLDVVSLAQHGVQNAVATLGTATTGQHVERLLGLAKRVIFCFDGDDAGRRAAVRALDVCLPHVTDAADVSFLFLPRDHDPDSYVRAFGADAFEAFVRNAVPLSRQLLEHAAAECDLSSAEGRARMLSQARPLWQVLPDGALRIQLLGELADLVQLTPRELGELWHVRPKGDTATPSRSNYQKDSYTRRYSDRKKPFSSENSDWGAPRTARRGAVPRRAPRPAYARAGPPTPPPAGGSALPRTPAARAPPPLSDPPLCHRRRRELPAWPGPPPPGPDRRAAR